MLRANYIVFRDRPEEPLFLKDIGPWSTYMTVTNNIEAVVEDLQRRNLLPPGRRLVYLDTENMWTEAVLKDGEFHHYEDHEGPPA